MIPMQERNLRERKRIRKAELLKRIADNTGMPGIAVTRTWFCHQILPSRSAAHVR
jgi:hypothetical protein